MHVLHYNTIKINANIPHYIETRDYHFDIFLFKKVRILFVYYIVVQHYNSADCVATVGRTNTSCVLS